MTFSLCQYPAPQFGGHAIFPQLNLIYNCCKSPTFLQLKGPACFAVFSFLIQQHYRMHNCNLRWRKGTVIRGSPCIFPCIYTFLDLCIHATPHSFCCFRPAAFLPWCFNHECLFFWFFFLPLLWISPFLSASQLFCTWE